MKIAILLSFLLSLTLAKERLVQTYFHSKTSTYSALTPTEYHSAITLFSTLLKQQTLTQSQQKSLLVLGLEVVHYGKSITILKTSKGRGFYLIRKANPHTKPANMLSLPHRFFDTHTGYIGYKMMREHPYRAAAFNTVHRKVMDAAHTDQTLFMAFHIAFASAFPHETIYQLHGFDNKTIHNTDTIISSTTMRPSSQSRQIDHCLRSQGYKSRLYGENISTLGGTTNTQANTLRDYSYHNFMHIELSKPLREHFKTEIKTRKRLIECLP